MFVAAIVRIRIDRIKGFSGCPAAVMVAVEANTHAACRDGAPRLRVSCRRLYRIFSQDSQDIQDCQSCADRFAVETRCIASLQSNRHAITHETLAGKKPYSQPYKQEKFLSHIPLFGSVLSGLGQCFGTINYCRRIIFSVPLQKQIDP
jgi:hypothetical protein